MKTLHNNPVTTLGRIFGNQPCVPGAIRPACDKANDCSVISWPYGEVTATTRSVLVL